VLSVFELHHSLLWKCNDTIDDALPYAYKRREKKKERWNLRQDERKSARICIPLFLRSDRRSRACVGVASDRLWGNVRWAPGIQRSIRPSCEPKPRRLVSGW
jgi:hypothetical protein